MEDEQNWIFQDNNSDSNTSWEQIWNISNDEYNRQKHEKNLKKEQRMFRYYMNKHIREQNKIWKNKLKKDYDERHKLKNNKEILIYESIWDFCGLKKIIYNILTINNNWINCEHTNKINEQCCSEEIFI